MAAIDDLNAVVATIQADVATAATLLTNIASGKVNADDPQVEAAAQALTQVDATLKAALAAATPATGGTGGTGA